MTGPEHFKEAERLLARLAAADKRLTGELMAPEVAAEAHQSMTKIAAIAQVHATLALTAATVDAAYGEMSVYADEAWVSTRGGES